MKLVDILARELKEWPCNLLDFAQQDYDKEIRFHSLDEEHSDGSHDFYIYERADDGCDESTVAGGGVKVTRAQWQAAVDALKAEAAPAWDGVGLPPVGADAEYNIGDGWYPCNIRYVLERSGEFSYALVAWCPHLETDQYLSFDRGCNFRKIRTPEQVEAEEREREVELAIQTLNLSQFCPDSITAQNTIRHVVGEMITAGYRKFEIVDKDDGEAV